MALLSLPDDLLACLLKFGLTIDLSHAARACSRLRAAAEAASEQILNSEAGPMFVPLGESYGPRVTVGVTDPYQLGSRFTWRTRLALSLREKAYGQTRKLVQLEAGLIVVGSWREGQTFVKRALAEALGIGRHQVTQLASDREPALAAEVSPKMLSRGGERSALYIDVAAEARERVLLGPAGYRALVARYDIRMEGIVADKVLTSPWFLASDVWMALRLGPRPALPTLPTAGPLVAVKTVMRSRSYGEAGVAPQTTIELRDATRKKVSVVSTVQIAVTRAMLELSDATRERLLGHAKLEY